MTVMRNYLTVEVGKRKGKGTGMGFKNRERGWHI